VLGSAAGGGFPQWNCACSNCRRQRNGLLRGRPRTQAQLACDLDQDHWLLVNASPDLRAQIEAEPCLHSRPGIAPTLRHTPIAGVVLTSAELDGTIGLLLLREYASLHIYATRSVRRILTQSNSMFRMIHREERQATWHDIIPGQSFSVRPANGAENGVRCLPLSLGGAFPEYVDRELAAHLAPDEAVLALEIEPISGGRKFLFAPSVGHINESLLHRLSNYDLLFWDGTFWSDDELISVRGVGRRATQMGHLPLMGPSGSLAQLNGAAKQKRLLIHINNTNPILDEDSAEYAQVRAAGWDVAADGMEFQL
jgi:pyrroloquinoline quinone biosynthesis protein B